MTGFGRSTGSYNDKTIVVELRSLNSKITDIKIRIPGEYRDRESEIRKLITDHAERGKQGIVSQVLREQQRVIVEGINLYNKHVKGQPDRGIAGRTITRERSLPYANVNLLDPVTGQPTRIFRKYLEDGTKVRVSKKSGAIIPRPEKLAYRKRPLNHIVTESDTLEADAWEVTYNPM